MFGKVFLTREKHALSVLEMLSERRSGINKLLIISLNTLPLLRRTPPE